MAAGEEATLSSQVGLLAVGHSAGKQVLAHKLTQGKCELPQLANHGEWELCFTDDDEHLAYLDSGAESLWAHELLKLNLYHGAGDAQWVVSQSGTTKALADVLTERENATVRVPVCSGPVDMPVAMFRARAGARLWWSIPAIFSGCGLTGRGTASRWQHSAMPGWAKLCSQLGLEEVHLRKGQAFDKAHCSDHAPETHVDERVLDTP